jgi:hypothetical protein
MRVSATLVVLAALVLVAVAGAATLDRGRLRPARITAIDMSNQAIASASAWTAGHCESVEIWAPDIRAAYQFRMPGPCPQTSTGRGVAAVSMSDNRVAWLSYAGGNTRDWTLWTASRFARKPLKLRFASADVDASPPIVLGNGSGDNGVIPYAVGADVVALSDNGRRGLSWHAPARVLALNADSSGATAVGVLLETGQLDVVSKVGAHVSVQVYDYAPKEVTAFRTIGRTAYVSTKSDIEIRTPTTTTPLDLGPGAMVIGFSDGNLVYTRGAEIRDSKRPNGEDVLLRHVKQPFLAEFDRRGLAWTAGRQVCFTVRVYLFKAFPPAPGC